MVDGYSKGEIFVKKVNNKTSNQKKAYSSKNSKYIQQAQKLFDENGKKSDDKIVDKKENIKNTSKSNIVKTNTSTAKKSGNVSVIAIKKTSSQAKKSTPTKSTSKNTSQTTKKRVVQGRPSTVSETKNTNKKVNSQSKVNTLPKEKNVKKANVDTEVQVKKKDVPVSDEKVIADKSKIKEAITKIEYEKAQEAAKKKTLELVEELKQKNNIKSSTKTVKKTVSATKNIQGNKQVKEDKTNLDKKNIPKVDSNKQVNKNVKIDQNVKKEQPKLKEKAPIEAKKVVEPKEDELLLKLQEELNKKDKEIISNLDLSIDENEEIKKEKQPEEKPVIKKVDNELKDLIEKEENKEKEEKINIAVKEEAKDKVENISSKKDTKNKKAKKRVTKFGKVLNIIAFIGFVFLVVTSVIIINKVHELGIIPNKYIYIGSGILSGFALIMLLFNITKSKVLHIIQILLTALLGTGFIYGTIFLTNVNNVLKDIFDNEEEQALYYVVVPNSSDYDSLDDLKDKRVGVLNQNLERVQEYLKDYNFEYKSEYNIAMLSEYLIAKDESTKIEAIIIEQSIYDYLEELDNKLFKSLKKIHEFSVDNDTNVEEEDPDMQFEQGKDEKPVAPEAPKRNPDLLKGVNIGNSFVVYINGVDGRGDTRPYGLSDVNMLVVVNPNTHKVLLVSVPRDYFVRVPGTTPGMRDKLTHAGLYGIDTSVGAMEGIFGIDINDYMQFGFNAVPIVVDSVGGVDVYSDTEFDSFHMKGWHVPKGWIHMDGKQALAYARERYAYINQGDKHRVKNQQDIVQAIIKKCTTDPQQLIKFDQILNGISPYFNTNISYERMQKLVKQQLNSLTPWTVEKISVDGYGGTQVTASYPNAPAYVMYPYESTIITAQQRILAVMTGN